MPSRPNGALNQGTPAYGYGPQEVRVVIIARSAADRRTQASKSSLELRRP